MNMQWFDVNDPLNFGSIIGPDEPETHWKLEASVDGTNFTEIETKPSNPKDLIGSNKIPFHFWPETASAMGAMACAYGNLQYGRTNWRAAGVKASIYYDALRRHMNAWFDEGEDNDPDSGLPHLAHALACIAIIIDAQAAGKLTDDRMVRGGYRELITKLTPHVARMKEKFKDKTPRHYTIKDSDV